MRALTLTILPLRAVGGLVAGVTSGVRQSVKIAMAPNAG